MWNFIKSNLLATVAVLSLLVALLSWGFTYYIWQESDFERVPVFVVDPSRTVVIDPSTVSEKPFNIIDKSGRQINKPVVVIKMYFWNAGKRSIKESDILESLFVSFNDPSIQILDSKIISFSRGVTSPFFKQSIPESTFHLGFRILEENDGFAIQVVYAGDPDATVDILGVIEGAKIFIVNENIEELESSSSFFWKTYLKKVGYYLLLSLASALFLTVIFLIINKLSEKYSMPKFVQKLSRYFVYIFWGLVIIFFLFLMPYLSSKRELKKNIIDLVPRELYSITVSPNDKQTPKHENR